MDYVELLNREPPRCSVRNPCWCVSVTGGAKVVTVTAIAFCAVNFLISIVFSAEIGKSFQNLVAYQASLNLSSLNYELPIHVYRRTYMKQYLIISIVAASFSLFSILAAIPSFLACFKIKPRMCYIWFANQILYMAMVVTVVILFVVSTSNPRYNSNSEKALQNEARAKIPFERILSLIVRNFLLLMMIAELVAHIWLFWSMAAYTNYLRRNDMFPDIAAPQPDTAMMFYSPTSDHPSQIKRYGKRETDEPDPSKPPNPQALSE